MGTLFGGGDNKTTETQSYQADPRAAAYAQWLSGQAQTLPGQGAVPLQGVEGFSPDQLAAFQGVRNVQGTYNPYAQRAEALNAEYGRGLDFGRVQDYYNQLSAGPLAQLQNQQRAQMAQTTRNAVQQAGGTGASRIGVTQANLANQQNLATGALQSGLLGQSVGAFQNDLAMKGAAAAQEANLGMGHTAQNYNDLGQLYGIGSAQQGLGQSRLNALYQQGMGQYQNPYQNLQYQSGVLGQLGNIFKGTQTTEKEVPEASIWPTLLGAGIGAAGSYFGGPAGGALLTSGLKSLFGGKADGGAVGMADGGAVNPFGGGPRSDLFNQMVKEYFPKNNSMVNPSGIGAGNPFGQMVPGQQTFAKGGPVNAYEYGGEAFDMLRNRFASEEGQNELGRISRMATERMGDAPFASRFDAAPGAPDLYDPETLATARKLQASTGYDSPYRTGEVVDEISPPLPQARPPFEMFPNKNPLRREKPAGEEDYAASDTGVGMPAGGRQLPPMPDTGFQAPERNPYGAIFNAIAASLASHGERMPSGHLKATGLGAALRTAGAGLDAGMKTHAAGREEDRKNYEAKLAGERLAEQAAMARLPYVEQTAGQRIESDLAERKFRLESAKPFRLGTDSTTGFERYGVFEPKAGVIRAVDPATGAVLPEQPAIDPHAPKAEDDNSGVALPPPTAGLSGQAIRNAAEVFRKSGAMPTNIGRGAQSGIAIKAIMNEAARLDAVEGVTPETALQRRQDYRGQVLALQRFTSGKQGDVIRSLNVVVDHVGTLRKLGEALKNGQYPLFNKLAQEWAKQTGKPAPTNFETARDIVGTEIIKSLGVAGAGTEKERSGMSQRFSRASSWPQLMGTIDEAVRPLLGGQLRGLRQQWKFATGRAEDQFNAALFPEVLQYLEPKNGAGSSPVDGRPIPTQADRDFAKKNPSARDKFIKHFGVEP